MQNSENSEQSKPVPLDCALGVEPCDGCHIPPIDCQGLPDCRPCDANWQAGYMAGGRTSAKKIMKMISRQKLCHDDEFLLFNAISKEFELNP